MTRHCSTHDTSARLDRDPSAARRVLAARLTARLEALRETNAAGRPDQGPMSFAQQRLWFVEQMTEAGGTYNMAVAVRLHGALDLDALSRSVDLLVDRHAALRTELRCVDGLPRQRVLPPSPGRLETHDEPPAMAGEPLERWLAVEARRPFDLAGGPLCRVVLWRLGDDDHVLLWVVHHILCDGFSMDLLGTELSQIYGALRSGVAPGPAPPGPTYLELCREERRRAAAGGLDAEVDAWRTVLDGAEELRLPARANRSSDRESVAGAVDAADGRTHFFALDADLSARVDAVAREHRMTVFMVLLTAFELALSSVTGQRDLVLGTSVSTRDGRAGGVVGLCVNQLILRTRLGSARTIADALAAVRRTVLDAFDRRHVPFDLLVQRLADRRHPGETPWMGAKFVFQPATEGRLSLPGLETRVLSIDRERSKFRLLLDMGRQVDEDGKQTLGGFFEYSRAHLSAATIASLRRRFEHVLGVMAHPDVGLEDLYRRLRRGGSGRAGVRRRRALAVPQPDPAALGRLSATPTSHSTAGAVGAAKGARP